VAGSDLSRLAVLIDADNASAAVAKELLEEVAKYGNLTNRIESRRKAVVPRETIELDADFDADERNAFFTRLMSELPGYKLKGVTNLRIAPSKRADADTDDDEELGKVCKTPGQSDWHDLGSAAKM
jgi:hypothetical protein